MPFRKRAPTRSSTPDWLQSQIDKIRAGRSSSIILHDPHLTEVPDEIRELRGLRTVVIGNEKIDRLPAWLGDLSHLEEIDAARRTMEALPVLPSVRWGVNAETLVRCGDELDPAKIYKIAVNHDTSSQAIERVFALGRSGLLKLSNLVIGTSITGGESRKSVEARWPLLGLIDSRIDEFLESQHDLSWLSLFGCPLKRIPEPLRGLRTLATLILGAVWPETVSDWLFEIPKLTRLNLGNDGLADLPESVSRALNLKALYLNNNPLTRLPAGVWQLKALETLDLGACPIAEIPADILRLKRLTELGLDAKKLVVPPPEVATNGLKAIKRYWSQKLEVGVDYLAEAKLLIVGESGAGKTSLAKKILDPGYVLNAGEDSTEGINVLAWQFPAGIRVRDEDGERVLERDFRVNIWDFGGQEIYHSTHQFFLTKRSVYALVTDERKEDTDFEYWLEVVNLLSDGSPLVIIQNQKQGRQQGIDLGALRQRYPNLCGALTLDLADNTGLEAAVAKIRRELEQLPHIGTSLPKTWRDVRLALEADPRNYISATEFFQICRSNGFTDRDDMRQLGGYLHDLGICLFFQDDPLLSKTVILKPEWGTGAVYRVLDDPEVARSLGVFRPGDLQRIWSDPVYESMHSELLQLMVKFALCFQVPGSDTYIAPQLLTSSQPTYHWDESDNLVLSYEYEVMPKGIVRRLIVALHDLIPPGDFLWRSGAIFEYDASRAEVIEQYRRRRLSIRIRGGDPRVLLGLIDHALGIIHRSYPGIKIEKFMPCNCPMCSASNEPGTFKVSELIDFVRTGHRIQCRASREHLDPLKLLNALYRDLYTEMEMKIRPDAPVQPEVFISYKRQSESDALADEIQSTMEARGVLVTRDKSEIRYRDSIQQFMRRLGAGKCVIVILSQEYLQSKYCMFELTEIADRPEFASRVYPVIMKDAAIFDPISRIQYIKYWEDQRKALEDAMRQVGQENLQGIREELDLYEKIRNTIAGIMNVLADMNTLTPETHKDTNFDQLYSQLTAALS